jgi:uncharacterized iron-regulated protein
MSYGTLEPADAMLRANATSYEQATQPALIYDTKAKAFLPPEPGRFLETALNNHSAFGEPPRVLFAGEVHTNPMHHKMQFELIKAANELDDKPLAIGLEMCYRQQQAALDEFVFGDGSLEKLYASTKWNQTWGYPLSNYAKIFCYARNEKIRLLGLNCPQELYSMVGKHGVEALPADITRYLPEMDFENPAHYERFSQAMTSAGPSRGAAKVEEKLAKMYQAAAMSEEKLDKMYQAQTLWDEYMAESIAVHMTSPPKAAFASKLARPEPALTSAPARMVVLAGTNHVQGHVGIPDRVTRRTKLPTFSMVPISHETWTPLGEPVIQEALDASEAEWLVYTRPADGVSV